MKKYILIGLITLGFAHQAGAMSKTESKIFRDTLAFVIEDAKKVHDMFFLEVKDGNYLGLNELNDIRNHHLELFDEKKKRLSSVLKDNHLLLEQDKQKIDEKIKLLISNHPGDHFSKIYNIQEMRSELLISQLIEDDISKICKIRKMLEKSERLNNYRDAIEFGRPYRDIRKPRSFFNDRWAIASALFCTAYFSAIFVLAYCHRSTLREVICSLIIKNR